MSLWPQSCMQMRHFLPLSNAWLHRSADTSVEKLNRLLSDDVRQFVGEETKPSAVKAWIAERVRALWRLSPKESKHQASEMSEARVREDPQTQFDLELWKLRKVPPSWAMADPSAAYMSSSRAVFVGRRTSCHENREQRNVQNTAKDLSALERFYLTLSQVCRGLGTTVCERTPDAPREQAILVPWTAPCDWVCYHN